MATRVVTEVSHITTQEAYQEHLKKLKGQIEKKNNKPAGELFSEKQKRIWDAIGLKEPDRVPVVFGWPDFAAKYCGLPYSAAYYEPLLWKAAFMRMMADFEPDCCRRIAVSSGAVSDVLQAKNTLWPGGTLPPDVTQQAVDDEYLREDEYDIFLEDSTDFFIRRYIPRVYGALTPLAKLPELSGRGAGLAAIAPLFTTPEYAQIAETLKKAGEEEKKYRQTIGNLSTDMESIGIASLPEGGGGAGSPAFDIMGNSYRGWKGIVTDMYRRPDKLIAALEKINRGQIARAKPADPKKKGPQLGGGGAIHRGADNFLSKKQWETFYWPTWKKSLQASIDLGYIPMIFAEGICDRRLEYFLEFPKGSLLVRLDASDMFRAKEMLGDKFCLMGNVPQALLQAGSTSEVDEHCRKLIQVCGKGGGFILRGATDAVQDTKPENLKTMVDSVKKYQP